MYVYAEKFILTFSLKINLCFLQNFVNIFNTFSSALVYSYVSLILLYTNIYIFISVMEFFNLIK